MTPLRSRYVTVRLAAVGELPAVVESDDDATVVVSLAVRAPDHLHRVLDRPVDVECVSPRGIQRVTGPAQWDPTRPDELRVARQSDRIVQRRDAVRVDATVPALLIVVSDDGARATTTTVNLSGNGALIHDPLGIDLGTHVRVDLELEAGGPPVTVEGEVVRQVGETDKGIRFDGVSAEGQRRLARFLTERQRAELRTARGR